MHAERLKPAPCGRSGRPSLGDRSTTSHSTGTPIVSAVEDEPVQAPAATALRRRVDRPRKLGLAEIVLDPQGVETAQISSIAAIARRWGSYVAQPDCH